MNATNFTLPVYSVNGEVKNIVVSPGEHLFVLGANGTGKSSLLQRFYSNMQGNVRRISAHRQTWLHGSHVSILGAQKIGIEQNLDNFDRAPQSRIQDQQPGQRSNVVLYDLMEAENIIARSVLASARNADLKSVNQWLVDKSPLQKINEILAGSNLPIEISFSDKGDGQIVASKNGGAKFGIAGLSDGERNALLIAGEVLTAKAETLFIIDEPERHLHRSIISPLLGEVFRMRSDCAFVVATHDLELPIDHPESRIVLVRSCIFSGNEPASWDVDVIDGDAQLPEELKRDVLGARKEIIFVEGQDKGLDRKLYAVLFPGVSVRAKGSSREVEQAVAGLRSTDTVHWAKAWGIIDLDGRETTVVSELRAQGIFALPFYSVESIYYHPDMIRGVAARQSAMDGTNAKENANAAISGALNATRLSVRRLACRAIEKSIRWQIATSLPNLSDIESGRDIALNVDTVALLNDEVRSLTEALDAGDWSFIVARCPVRETPALNHIVRSIGLTNRAQYESSVISLLKSDSDVLKWVRRLLGELWSEILVGRTAGSRSLS